VVEERANGFKCEIVDEEPALELKIPVCEVIEDGVHTVQEEGRDPQV